MKVISYNTGFRMFDKLLTIIAYVVTTLSLTILACLLGSLICYYGWLAK